MTTISKTFQEETRDRIRDNREKTRLIESAHQFLKESTLPKYSYNFTWLGRPIIQYPQDIVVMQEIIWRVQPDLIIETGIAHGGSLIFSASMLELLASCDPDQNGQVLGIDVDIRPHNRKAIESHPMYKRIEMIEGSSVDDNTIKTVSQKAAKAERILVCLDSNHTHEHVLRELEAYAPMVSSGSYCVVFDTMIEDLPDELFPDRPWGKGNNPKTAVYEYLKSHPEFEIDKSIDDQILISVAPHGFLYRK